MKALFFHIKGSAFLNDCPLRPSIPIVLILYGIFGIFNGLLQYIKIRFDTNKKIIHILQIVFGTALIITFITCKLLLIDVFKEFKLFSLQNSVHYSLYE